MPRYPRSLWKDVVSVSATLAVMRQPSKWSAGAMTSTLAGGCSSLGFRIIARMASPVVQGC